MQRFRTIVFWLHLICGVAAGLVIFTMSATGVVLTYEKQFLRWADGFDARADCADAKPLGPEALLAKARSETGKTPTAILFRSAAGQPTRLSYGRESQELNPCTGAAMGPGATRLRAFFRTMIVWHRWLGQEGDGRAVGKAITGACNLAFVFIVISGAYIWWPKEWTWKRLRPVVLFRGGLRGKARDFNWHNVFGLWCGAALFVVAGTAIFFSYSWSSDLLYALTGEERPQRSGGPAQPGGEAGPRDFTGLDALWEKAASMEPAWRTITLRVPPTPEAPVSFTLDRGNGFRPDLRSTLVLDRRTGAVERHLKYADNSTAQNTRVWIRWLHTGEAGGFIGQTVAGIASLGACFLVYTGWMLSWRRFQAWRQRRQG